MRPNQPEMIDTMSSKDFLVFVEGVSKHIVDGDKQLKNACKKKQGVFA